MPVRKARKDHACADPNCGKPILKGMRYFHLDPWHWLGYPLPKRDIEYAESQGFVVVGRFHLDCIGNVDEAVAVEKETRIKNEAIREGRDGLLTEADEEALNRAFNDFTRVRLAP